MHRLLSFLLLIALPGVQASASGLYRYVDAAGVVTYSNIPPSRQATLDTSSAHSRPTAEHPDDARLARLLQQDLSRPLTNSQPPFPATNLTMLAEHTYQQPWRGTGYIVSQGANGSFSHNTPQSRYALDIAMPRGTPIYAARAGHVVKVKDGEEEGGRTANGNYVRVLHSDGTSSAYLHLLNGSMQVAEGQYVKAGTRLASSGNSGRSTGPHLHLVIQKPVAGRLESIPFELASPTPQLPNFAAGLN